MLRNLLLLVLLSPLASVWGQTDVLTQHNDNARTGQNLNETILSPSNVNSTSFGKLFSSAVDGYVYAQPLYKSNVSIAGVAHNVLYIATEGDSVYAFDADNSEPLWHASLIDMVHGATSGETTVDIQSALGDPNCTDLVPQVGITSTPVIDPTAGVIYVEAKSEKANGTIVHRLHILDITTGAEKSPGPVVVTATVPGTSDGSTTITFDALHELNRPGLLLTNGSVYLAYASHCDKKPFHGWVFAYGASTLALTAAFVTTPNASEGEGGIWMSGAGLAADSNGNIFTATGNGTFDGVTDFGDSILKMGLSGNTLSVADSFTPYNQGYDDLNDSDLGSGGVLLLPDQSGSHPHELVEAGKGGTIYLLDRDQLTTNNQHYCSNCSSDPEIVQEIQNAGVPQWLFSAPGAYWSNNNTVYFWGSSDVLKAFSLTSGLLSATPSSTSATFLGFPGATPSISANGNTNGIAWAIDSTQYGSPGPGPGPAVLHAYDATNVANELWNSSLAPNNRDAAGNAVKFTVPTIANGKVYIGTQNQITAYGLLGSNPQQVATPSFSPAGGTYGTAQSVTISDTTGGAVIYYTTDGSTPTTSSAVFGVPIPVSSTETIKAMATASGMNDSLVATAIYTIQSAGSTPSYSSGFTSGGLTLNGNAALNGTRLRLTDGTTGRTSSAFFSTLVNVQSFTNDFSFQLTNATADGFTFTIQGNSPTALGMGGGSLGYGPNTSGVGGIGQSVAVKFDLYNNSGEGSDSTGLYTNGARPTLPSVDMTNTGIDLHSGDVMNVHMTYDGTTLTWTISDSTAGTQFTTSAAVNIPNIVGGSTAYVGFTGASGGLSAIQDILTWTYVASGSSQVATPSFSPAGGTYGTAQSVTISDTTGGAVIYYTTDGSTPTTSSAVFGVPIPVSSTETIKAMATASGMNDSLVATAIYTIQSAGSTPSYSSGFTSGGLTLNGNAALNGTRLRLTDGTTGRTSSAFFSTLVNVQSFTNDFSFQLTNATADGFTFTIQGNSPTALGMGGGSLGYGPNTSGVGGIGQSVAVKFDLYDSSQGNISGTGLYTNGAFPGPTGNIDMAPSGIDLHSGDVMNVHMTYDGTTLTWTITDPTTGASFSTSANINIATTVGGASAYVGFTGADGGLTAIQDILTWTYTPGSSPQQVATPSFSPAGGTYGTAQSVTISDTTGGAVIYYTTDGSTPTTSSAVFGVPIPVSSTETIKAMATASGMNDSLVATAIYTIQSAGSTPSYSSGFTSGGLTLNGNAALNGTRLRLTDGTTGRTSSAFFSTLVNVQSFTNDFSFQLTNATADGFTFTIQGNSPTALGMGGGSLGYGPNTSGVGGIGQSVAVKFDLYNNSGEGSDSTGLYTNGARPTLPSVDMTNTGIDLHSGDVMNVHMTYDGTTLTWTISDSTAGTQFTTSAAVNIPNIVGGSTAYVGFTGASGGLSAIQDILTWTYVASGSSQVATPSFSPAGGTYGTAQSVTISDTTGGAVIYYTTDGSTPTTSSAVFGVPIPVSSTETIKAMATASGMNDSLVATAIYTIQSAGSTPSYSSGFTSGGLTLNGNAALNGTRLRLTDGTTGRTSSAFFSTLVNVQSFTNDFSFQLTNATADGFTFTIQGNSPTALGMGGGSLGYGPNTSGVGGIGQSVAVKFDLYDSSQGNISGTGLYTNGAFPGPTGNIDMAPSGIDLHSGDVMNVHMTYDGTTLTWTITDPTTGASFSTSANINIATTVGGASAYVGFTGADGGLTAIQDILTWNWH